MTTAPSNGREANERGYYLRDCPFPGDRQKREQWTQEWNDAQIDREVWEDENFHRAHSFS